MAKKFNLTELLNQRSVEQQEVAENSQKTTGLVQDETEELMMIDVYDLIPSRDNFYHVDDALKSSIELVGILQPLLVSPLEGGKYRVIAGHRRRLAVLSLLEEGKEERRFLPCVFKAEPVMERLALIMANRFRDKTDWEKMMEAMEAEELAKELKKEYQVEGRTREVLSEITGLSETQLGRYKAIYKNLEKELMSAFKDNAIGFSVASELCGLSEASQRQANSMLNEKGVLSVADVKILKEQEKVSEQISGQMNLLEGVIEEKTVEERPEEIADEVKIEKPVVYNPSVSYPEELKIEELTYSEEQPETEPKKEEKPKARQQEKELKKLPSGIESKEHQIIISPTRYVEIVNGELTFFLLQKAGYKVGKQVELSEFAEGKETGKIVKIEIQYLWENEAGLEDGYCIIGFSVITFGSSRLGGDINDRNR